MARYTDASNYYYLSLRSSNELSLRKLVNGSITVLGTVPFTVTPGQPYALRLEAVGTKLRAYVNGEMLLEANDTSHASGRYGVLTYRAAATFGSYLAWAP
jgi:hypothetical protein